jgi:hypothetical protein
MTPEIGQTIPHGRRFDEAQTSDCRLAHFSVGPHTSSTAGSSSDSPRQPRFEDCMDLKDSVGWVLLLAQAHDEVLRISREQGLPLPRQTGSTHRLDRVVIEVTVAILEREGIRIRAVRAVFAERAPAFPGSFLSEGSRVQLAVRDTDLIGNVDVVPAGFLGAAPPPRAAGAATANAVSPWWTLRMPARRCAGTSRTRRTGTWPTTYVARRASPSRSIGSPEPTPARVTLHRHGRWTPTWRIGRRYCVIAHWV